MGRRRLIIDCEQLALAWINVRSRRSSQDRAFWYRFPAAMSSLAADPQDKRWREQSLRGFRPSNTICHVSSVVLWTLGFLDILASWRRPQA
jgi:hypothetical protein